MAPMIHFQFQSGFEQAGCRLLAVCHEHRRSTRRCATVREMKVCNASRDHRNHRNKNIDNYASFGGSFFFLKPSPNKIGLRVGPDIGYRHPVRQPGLDDCGTDTFHISKPFRLVLLSERLYVIGHCAHPPCLPRQSAYHVKRCLRKSPGRVRLS